MTPARAWTSYEERLVPRLAAPFLDDIVDALSEVLPGRFVLDLAAGTGMTGDAVAAARADLVTVAVDLDEHALTAARTLSRNTSRALVADAQRLPIRTNGLGAVVCQQGLQFVPDLDLVCHESRRVLHPGGSLVALTWAALDEVCVFASLSELADSIGVGPAFRDPCSLDPDRLAESLDRAGLVVTSQRRISRTLPVTRTKAEVADLLAYWVEDSDSVLVDPWRSADQPARDAWIAQFDAGLSTRARRLTAVLTVASC